MGKTINQDVKEIEKSFDDLGIVNANADALAKADTGVHNLDNTNFGGLLPRELVDDILDDVHDQGGWISELNTFRRQNRKATVPILRLNENISEGIGSEEAPTHLKRVATTNYPYECMPYAAVWSIHLDMLKEARAAGMGDFQARVTAAFAKQLSNDYANIILRSDTTLDDSTSMNKMLRMIDGMEKQCESANVLDAEGLPLGIVESATTPDHFAAMEDAMPEIYANDPDLHWFFNRRVSTHIRAILKQRISDMGDKAMEGYNPAAPNGIPTILVPQISVRQGPDAIAPTSAADGTTYITFVLTTLVTAEHVASAAAGVGRKFKVTCLATGQYEICTGFQDTTLQIVTSGLLGQTTVSTTNTHYEVGLYDETDIYLANPKAITVVDCYDMETYRKFEPEFRRWVFYTYYWKAVLIPIKEAIVKLKRVCVTPKKAII